MVGKQVHKLGLRGWHLHTTSLGFIWFCLGLWVRAKTVDQAARGNAERRAIFVGLWPPMFLVRMADSQVLNVVSLEPDRFAKSAARTYERSCRPSARVAFLQPTFWVLMAAMTPARALVP